MSEQKSTILKVTGRQQETCNIAPPDTIRLESSGFYVCGSNAMHSFVLKQLQACGVHPSRVGKALFGVFHFGKR